MKLTKKSQYAIRAMISLARAAGCTMTISRIAEQEKIPKKFLEQILLALKGSGLVDSHAGPRGGYVLVSAPQQVSIADILQAVEEPLSRPMDIAREPGRVETMISDIRSYVRRRMQEVTLADLATEPASDEQVQELMWYI